MYPLFQVRNGDPFHSDHRPVIIDTEPVQRGERRNDAAGSFKFEASWLQEEGCRKVIEDAWGEGVSSVGSLGDQLRAVAASLRDWSKNILGDLEKRLRKAKKELEKWRRAPISDLAVGREAVWSFKVDGLEEQIDLYWRQRAHVNWLRFGDRNTKYFHNLFY